MNLDLTFVLSHWAITLTATGVACFEGGLQKRIPKNACSVLIQVNCWTSESNKVIGSAVKENRETLNAPHVSHLSLLTSYISFVPHFSMLCCFNFVEQ